MSDYSGEERRKSMAEQQGLISDSDVTLLGLIYKELQAIKTDVHEIRSAQKAGDARLTEHIAKEETDWSSAVKDAYANADPIAHRMWHEADIAEKNERAKMFHAVTEKVLSGGVLAVCGGVATAVWYWMKDHVK